MGDSDIEEGKIITILVLYWPWLGMGISAEGEWGRQVVEFMAASSRRDIIQPSL